ncbi:hypothetical protein, partial [Pseudomonas aeruginosa]|uniref:hypothetical protein n=1 Tax=Pseudomonas aeruginosa TaxID=287 RepID=UPI001C3FC205
MPLRKHLLFDFVIRAFVGLGYESSRQRIYRQIQAALFGRRRFACGAPFRGGEQRLLPYRGDVAEAQP